MNGTSPSAFLAHVNGMRALAILGILFYHLNAAYCPTGYFGVDVFLVISGYFLLASLLKAEKPGDVHYGSYLLKKSWRIIPPWFLVSCVFCFGSVLFMIPPDRVEICSTAYRSAYFGADFYIDRLYDYFNQKAHQNLFLHFWYLSLTCQMYIVMPLLVMLLLRFLSKRACVIVLGIVGILSLLLYAVVTTPEVPLSIRQSLLSATGMQTAYYHLLPRLWEILAGGAILLLPAWQNRRCLRMVLESLGALGIILSFFCFETGSAQVYVAVISAILLIRYGGEGWASRLLSCRPLQWVGTISFSLYLWHWPIMAAWKYVSLSGVQWYDELGMVLLSFLLAALAWRWVEQLRMPRAKGRLMVCLRFLPLALILVFVLGMRPYYKHIKATASDGLAGQGLFEEIYNGMSRAHRDDSLLKGFPTEHFPRKPVYIGTDESVAPSFIIMGDSHSIHCVPGMQRYCTEKGLRGVAFNNMLEPLWGCRKEDSALWTPESADALLQYVKQQESIKYVFIVLLWENRLYGTPNDNGGATMDWHENHRVSQEEQDALREDGLRETCRRFSEAGVRVVLLGDIPMLPPNLSPYQLELKVRMLRNEEAPEYLTPVQVHKEKSARYTQFLTRMVEEGVAWAYIDGAEALRRGDVYRTRNDRGQHLYSDNNHLTYIGSELVCARIMSEWERLQREKVESRSEESAPTGKE